MRGLSFAVYSGPSMNPTLREPEILEVVPYGAGSPRAGDVVLFPSPEADRQVVHRIVRITPEGISTRGDNNAGEDPYTLQSRTLVGRVVAARLGGKRRGIAGGPRGLLKSRWIRLGRLPGRFVSRLLHPLYAALSRRGLLARLLPASCRPRVVVFRSRDRDRFRLLVGHHVVGWYDERSGQWQIRRPFRLFADERKLPVPQE